MIFGEHGPSYMVAKSREHFIYCRAGAIASFGKKPECPVFFQKVDKAASCHYISPNLNDTGNI
jgi:hypothetical protein